MYVRIYIRTYLYCSYANTIILIGGNAGAFGKNVLKRKKDGLLHHLGPKASVQVLPGVSYGVLRYTYVGMSHTCYGRQEEIYLKSAIINQLIS